MEKVEDINLDVMRRSIEIIREQTIEYVLYRMNNCTDIDEAREILKSDLRKLHLKNMCLVYTGINEVVPLIPDSR